MRKHIKRLLSLLLVVTVVISMTGCTALSNRIAGKKVLKRFFARDFVGVKSEFVYTYKYFNNNYFDTFFEQYGYMGEFVFSDDVEINYVGISSKEDKEATVKYDVVIEGNTYDVEFLVQGKGTGYSIRDKKNFIVEVTSLFFDAVLDSGKEEDKQLIRDGMDIYGASTTKELATKMYEYSYFKYTMQKNIVNSEYYHYENNLNVLTMMIAEEGDDKEYYSGYGNVIEAITNETLVCINERYLDGSTEAEAIDRIKLSGYTPDLVYAGDGLRTLYDADLLIELDEYIENNETINSLFTKEELEKFRQEDGHIYWLNFDIDVDRNSEEFYSKGVAITVFCKSPETVMYMFDQLVTPEIMDYRFWGIQGEDYVIDDDGNFYRTANMQFNWSLEDYREMHVCEYSHLPRATEYVYPPEINEEEMK
ncbi:MAG: hypothetical protein MJ166_09810 [Clostridia bacterium]|nr:hypothetical protein [Clostridia bacterium]